MAIPIPQTLSNELSILQSNILGVRWIDPENLHLTLSFIGDVSFDQLPVIKDTLEQVEFSSFDLDIKGTGYFGTKKTPKVLWVGIPENKELQKLQRLVVDKLRQAGFEMKSRKYIPHITVARISKCSYRQIAPIIQNFSLFSTDSFTAGQFNLYSSDLTPSGAKYSVVASFKLK